MVEAVDSIIADLSVRYQQYVTGFDAATAAHKRFTESVPGKTGFGATFSTAEIDQYTNRHKKGAEDVAAASEASAGRIKRAAKEKSEAETTAAAEIAKSAKAAADAEKAQAKAAADAVKAAAREKVAAEKATAREIAKAQRDEARETAAQQRRYYAAGPKIFEAKARQFRSLNQDAATVPVDDFAAQREAAAKTRLANLEANLAKRPALSQSEYEAALARHEAAVAAIPAGVTGGVRRDPFGAAPAVPEAEAVKEVNHALADQATLQANLTAAKGRDKAAIREQIAEIRLENQLRRAGLADEEILLRLEERRAFVAAEQAAAAKKQSLSNVARFGEAAGIGRTGGSLAAVAGLAVVGGATAVAAAAKEGLDYANSLAILSKQLGLTTRDLQVYQSGAERLGVTNEQLRTSFGQLASNIGKAQEGAKEQGKIFGPGGLNVDLGNARDGFKSLSDLLPTLVDRFSKIKDPARRAALETALFGEQGRRLDALLSGGTGAIEALGNELERTGGIMSGEAIGHAAKTADDLKRLGDQLERELATTVSNNAAAISSLAKSLLDAASSLLHFIDAFQRLQAVSAVNSGNPEVAARGRATLNQTPEGRGLALYENTRRLRYVREAGKSSLPFFTLGPGSTDTLLNTDDNRKEQRKELLRQRREIIDAANAGNAANASATTLPQGGNPGNLNVFAPDPKKGPKGKSAESIEAERLERAKRFATEEAQEQLARLGYLSDLTSDTRQQDEYARQRIRIEQSAKDAETRDQAEATINRQKLKGADAAIERARAEQLVKENAVNADLAIRVINQHEQSRVLEEQLAHLQTSNDILADGLNAQLALATTAKERATIEKRLLALSIESERAALQKQIDDKATTPEARADAIARRDALPGKQRDQEKVLDRQNEGPLARYRHTFDDPETQIEQAVADKLKAVDDAISDAASKVLGIKDPLLKSLLQIFLQQNVLRPLYDALQSAGHGGGGGIGGIFGSVLGAIGLGGGHSVGGSPISGSLFGLLSKGNGVTGPGFASGGSLVIGGNGGIDQNQLSLNGSPIARVGRGEVLSIGPNVAASNQSVRSASMSPIIIAPQHYDLSGVVMTETLVQGLREDNRRYADHVGRAAVQASGAQAPGVIQRKQTLGN